MRFTSRVKHSKAGRKRWAKSYLQSSLHYIIHKTWSTCERFKSLWISVSPILIITLNTSVPLEFLFTASHLSKYERGKGGVHVDHETKRFRIIEVRTVCSLASSSLRSRNEWNEIVCSDNERGTMLRY